LLHSHDDDVLVRELACVDELALQLAQRLEQANVGGILRLVALVESAVEGVGQGAATIGVQSYVGKTSSDAWNDAVGCDALRRVCGQQVGALREYQRTEPPTRRQGD
jgi:hypothetical protein